ncbi:GTP-binding protein YihA2 [Plasmodium brasilianum]|uniref:GTP-binding protein, putative n=2 Tax=Plasmodium (Plasmodium) TaxID=418103 RepID=A0A1A8W7E8_PLAMA|nr:GTP-binding protein, putative [Plasmodium malariae]KAI4836851.1 GTP-binding protein YihA2 [Plasmodium brasilianum]SBS88927.1 GTP-binding protein, putative [Plasmodium malariae]SCO94150.1 GTP-binding protein, putative [Plasmodium malariae]
MHCVGYFFRKYSSLNNKLKVDKIKTNVNIVNEEMTSAISRRQKEKGMKLDLKIYEQLRKKMLGKPLNKLQKKYMNEKRPKFAPIFLDQLKPRMILYKVAIQVSELPLPKYPEIAFIGRSNCGKSTLINELCGRTNKAKVSKLPGCTKQIHFYKIAKPCLLCLVDLPGYGFAHSKEELRLQWNEFTLFYLKNRKNLKKVFVLIDCRVGLKTSDKELLHFFDRYNIKYQIILSKCDLLNTKDLAIKIQIINEEIFCFKNLEKPIIPLSSIKRQNLNELRSEIAKYQLNKTIVKNNIIMKINDLIEQKKLKKLKNVKGVQVGTNKNEGEKESSFSTFTASDILSERKKKRNKNNSENSTSKDILISDDTIFEALNRWKVCDKITLDATFNKYMHFHANYLIKSLKQRFIENCLKEFNKQDLQIIDDIIENYDKQDKCDAKQTDVVVTNHQLGNTGEQSMICKQSYKASDANVDYKQRKYKKKGQLIEYGNKNTCIKSDNTINCDIDNYSKNNEHNSIDLSLPDDTNNKKWEDILAVKNEHVTYSDVHKNMHSLEIRNDQDFVNQLSHENYLRKCSEDLVVKENASRTIDGSHKKEIDEHFNIFSMNGTDNGEIENEILHNSLLLCYKIKSNHSEYIYSENVKMESLFEKNNKKLGNDFKCMDYSKIKEDVLLEEEDTYSSEDFVNGLKRNKKEFLMDNDSLSSYTFNLKDKSTHHVYEKNKSEAYKIYRSKMLENLCDVQNIFNISERGVKNTQQHMSNTKNNSSSQIKSGNILHKGTTIRNSFSKEMILEGQRSSREEEENIYIKKNYIGLKTRKKIIKGTKKLKLFGKKRAKEIVNTPIDLATDYFKLSNKNSTFLDKKKNSWNYISSKYNKWLKKVNRKNTCPEIISSVKKEDVMIRYVQKQESKYKKEKNKLSAQKKNLGMITKPPNHKKIKKISRNFTLSDEQKIFDREAFFKYRDVEK